MVMAGAADDAKVFTRAEGFAGHPAATAALFTAAWSAFAAAALSVVEVVDFLDLDGVLGDPPTVRTTRPITTPAATTPIAEFLSHLRRFTRRACAARFAWRAAFCLARFSVGTARHHIGSPGVPE